MWTVGLPPKSYNLRVAFCVMVGLPGSCELWMIFSKVFCGIGLIFEGFLYFLAEFWAA